MGVPGIFALTGVLALAAVAVVRYAVPDPDHASDERSVSRGQFAQVLVDTQLVRLNFGTFALHAVLMAMFTQIPFALRDNGLAAERHWVVYFPVLIVSILLMLPFIRQVDRPGRGKPLLNAAVVVLLGAQVALAFTQHALLPLCIAMTFFFAALNLLEAMLPSLISKCAPADARGAAIGVNSSMQFLGAFVGATAGGWFAEHVGETSVFLFGVALTVLWLIGSATMAAPPARFGSNYSMGET
jgi:predicted MFS family arabinose efflux permease